MKRIRIITVMVTAVIIILSLSSGQAYAMTPEQKAMYDEWYQARFGTSRSTPTQTTTPATQQPTKGSIQSVTPSSFEIQLASLVNADRVKSGLKPVTLDPQLVAVARVKAEDMIKNNYYAHGSSYGYSGSMLAYFGIKVVRSRENICQASSPQEAHRILMGSRDHKANILKPYWEEVGIGVVRKPNSSLYYVVQIFVER